MDSLKKFEKYKATRSTLKENRNQLEPEELILCKVVSASLITGTGDDFSNDYMWLYYVAPITVSYTPNNFPTIAQRSNDVQWEAFSISELGNIGSSSTVSYGVPLTDIPAGFEPVRIPNGTPVICCRFRTINHGQVIYLIINTQAITGVCA